MKGTARPVGRKVVSFEESIQARKMGIVAAAMQLMSDTPNIEEFRQYVYEVVDLAIADALAAALTDYPPPTE
jgi:hypothetical protein